MDENLPFGVTRKLIIRTLKNMQIYIEKDVKDNFYSHHGCYDNVIKCFFKRFPKVIQQVVRYRFERISIIIRNSIQNEQR